MDHGPSSQWGEDNAAAYKTRIGMRMFLLYCIVYGGFVLINSLWPKLMEKAIGGLNLAVVYGFGLIILALVMALIYNALACREEQRLNDAYTDDEQEEF